MVRKSKQAFTERGSRTMASHGESLAFACKCAEHAQPGDKLCCVGCNADERTAGLNPKGCALCLPRIDAELERRFLASSKDSQTRIRWLMEQLTAVQLPHIRGSQSDGDDGCGDDGVDAQASTDKSKPMRISACDLEILCEKHGDASFEDLEPWLRMDFDHMVLHPRGLRAEAIEPVHCPALATSAERKAHLQGMLRAHELASIGQGKPVVHGPVQRTTFAYAGGVKRGFAAAQVDGFEEGAARIAVHGQCHRRGCPGCSLLNLPFYELGPSTQKSTKGTLQPVTTTGDNYCAIIEPYLMQRKCIVTCMNMNLGTCSCFVEYKVTKDGNVKRRPHCYAPRAYVDAEQACMDFERRYLDAPDRQAHVRACASKDKLAVLQIISFSKPTTTGTAAAVPSTASPGEVQCKLLFVLKHPTFATLAVRAYEHTCGACEAHLELSINHLSSAAAVEKTQTFGFGNTEGAMPGKHTATASVIAFGMQLMCETAERLGKLPSANLTQQAAMSCLKWPVARLDQAAALVVMGLRNRALAMGKKAQEKRLDLLKAVVPRSKLMSHAVIESVPPKSLARLTGDGFHVHGSFTTAAKSKGGKKIGKKYGKINGKKWGKIAGKIGGKMGCKKRKSEGGKIGGKIGCKKRKSEGGKKGGKNGSKGKGMTSAVRKMKGKLATRAKAGTRQLFFVGSCPCCGDCYLADAGAKMCQKAGRHKAEGYGNPASLRPMLAIDQGAVSAKGERRGDKQTK